MHCDTGVEQADEPGWTARLLSAEAKPEVGELPASSKGSKFRERSVRSSHPPLKAFPHRREALGRDL